MHLVVSFLFLVVVGCYCDLRVSIDQNGAYNVTINNQVWLRSARTAIYAGSQWYSTENGTLTLAGTSMDQGTDPILGSWNETKLTYNLVRNQTTTQVTARIRQWSIVSALTFYLETGDQALTSYLPLDYEQVRTIFPSFYIEKFDANDQRGYFTVGSAMGGFDDLHAGNWNASSHVVKLGLEDGPVTLFNVTQKGEGDVLIFSPFSHFMATSLTQRTNPPNAALEYGVMGSISTIPANYTQSFILFYSYNGINRAIRDWGTTMQKAYNRTNEYRLNDVAVTYLSYYTNNGGYYYYNTETGVNYEQTMIDVAHLIKLPYRSIELDSWWYYKGLGNGVKEWRAMPDVFPNGLAALHRQLNNIPLGAHNRYWAYDNVYKDKYAFSLDVGTSKALPIGNDSFWLDFFVEAHNWGLAIYVQDWFAVQTKDFHPLRTDIHLGAQWLKSMGAAADTVGINIQYCMSYPRHYLQAIEIPRVTHARASDDYAVSLMNHAAPQWNIGVTSMLIDAMGIAPFKDVLWSTTVQPGSPYSSNATELVPDRQIVIATLSTGPVAFGDGINLTNVERLMRCCRADGLILKPDRPITSINEIIADWASNNGVMPGELYSTQTTINERNFHIIFASAMKQDYTVYPSMIEDGESGVIWSYDNVQVTSTFDDTHPVTVSASKCNQLSICLWYISPVWQFNDAVHTKYALLGEYNKWTAVSRQRFISITTNTEKTQATIVVQGVASEVVPIVVYHSTLQTQTVNCQISANGQANLVVTPTKMACS